MNRKFLSPILISTTLLAAACGQENIDSEACEHFEAAPAPSPGGNPIGVNSDHRRYDLILVSAPETDGKLLTVSFTPPESGRYVLFTNADVPVTVDLRDGTRVPKQESAKSSPECSEIKGRHVVALEGMTLYRLTLGPSRSEQSVSLVIEKLPEEPLE
jgi:hypothetical protein